MKAETQTRAGAMPGHETYPGGSPFPPIAEYRLPLGLPARRAGGA